MSVLLEFSMFPTDKGESVSNDVSKVISMVRDSGIPYKLTPMGTVIEADTMNEALNIVQKAHDLLASDADRIYSSIKIDVRKNKENQLAGKVESVEKKIGQVNK